MDSPKQGLDLEKELTCSICTELLYQPLTLLDCLHTFCGSCLKEWFSFQAAKIERNPDPPSADAIHYSCPSCRAPVRDTRHNATVVTLLDMFVKANPDKARTEAEREDMAKKYTPGEHIMPKITIQERTTEERRADDEDRRLMDEVRERSLREATGGPPLPPRTRRHRDGPSTHSRSRSSGDQGSDSRRRRDGSNRPQRDDGGRQSLDGPRPNGDRSRRRTSESRQRQVEHQSSLRSLISSDNMDERDIDREIEEFARQIQEEGLLDGLDLDNIDLTRDDELSRRITESYRRRQRERIRAEATRRGSNTGQNGSPRASNLNLPDGNARSTGDTSSSRSRNRSNPHSRSTSTNDQTEDRSRPPPVTSDSREGPRGARRRATSGSRTTTAPVAPMYTESRPAARSQTDLTLRTPATDLLAPRPGFEDGRSSSTPNVPSSSPPPAVVELPGSIATSKLLSFANRVPQTNPSAPPRSSTPPELAVTTATGNISRTHRPAELAIVHTSVVSPSKSPTTRAHHQRARSQLYPEPSISCARCRRPHIEYKLHYNCHVCSDGQWNICMDCYRAGKGCQYWFGFGYGAWTKWEKKRQQDQTIAKPHMLTASRYIPPVTQPGGADGRKTLTTDDPRNRLESGTFCARCYVWTNDCYWRCDVCNEGDWGFCNNCVNQGKSCTHMILPLSHEITRPSNGRPVSPRSPGRPPKATVLTGPQASNIGPFRPLTFTTRCDVCQDSIAPSQPRYHCFSCTSVLVTDAVAGDYDICIPCYNNLVSDGDISFENGHSGWRRCLHGHRMAIVGFADGKVGQWRYVDRDIVGGRVLRSESHDSRDHADSGLQKWSWKQGDQEYQRLVTREVKDMAPATDGGETFTQTFPPDGGNGRRAVAKWAWHPQADADDELLFPRGAEIREIEDVNGDWFFGTYMGAKGLFPAPYVRMD